MQRRKSPCGFRELNWGLRTWDQWSFNDCDKPFGDDEWPKRYPCPIDCQYSAKEEDPRGNQPVRDNFKPGRIVSTFFDSLNYKNPKCKKKTIKILMEENETNEALPTIRKAIGVLRKSHRAACAFANSLYTSWQCFQQ